MQIHILILLYLHISKIICNFAGENTLHPSNNVKLGKKEYETVYYFISCCCAKYNNGARRYSSTSTNRRMVL